MDEPNRWLEKILSAPRLVPAVFALSVGRFLTSLDPERVGSSYYFDEVAPRFLRR